MSSRGSLPWEETKNGQSSHRNARIPKTVSSSDTSASRAHERSALLPDLGGRTWFHLQRRHSRAPEEYGKSGLPATSLENMQKH